MLAGTEYRYGFNGIEKAKELYSGAYEADFRMVDSRIGRWFSPDPVVKPWESPYAGFSNNPVWFIDPSGLDPTNGNGTSIPTGGNDGEKPKTGDTQTRTNKDGYQTTYVYKDGMGWTLPDSDVVGSSNGGSPGTSSNSGSNRASTGRILGDNPYRITTGIPGLGGIVYNKSWEKTFMEVSEGFSKRMSSNMTWGATSLPMPVYDDDDDAQTRRNKAVGAILADFLSIEIGTAEITAGALGEIASFGFGSALFLPMIAHGVGVVTTSGIALSTDVQMLFMADAVVTDSYHDGSDDGGGRGGSDDGGNGGPPPEDPNLDKPMNRIVPGRLQKSKSWDDGYGKKTLRDIIKDSKTDKKAQDIWKLYRDQKRLMDKLKNK